MVLVVLLTAVVDVPGHGAQRPVSRGRADGEIAAGRRGQRRRAVRRPGTAAAMHAPSAAARRSRRRGRFVVGTLGHASVPVRFVNVIIVFHDGHHKSHNASVYVLNGVEKWEEKNTLQHAVEFFENEQRTTISLFYFQRTTIRLLVVGGFFSFSLRLLIFTVYLFFPYSNRIRRYFYFFYNIHKLLVYLFILYK